MQTKLNRYTVRLVIRDRGGEQALASNQTAPDAVTARRQAIHQAQATGGWVKRIVSVNPLW